MQIYTHLSIHSSALWRRNQKTSVTALETNIVLQRDYRILALVNTVSIFFNLSFFGTSYCQHVAKQQNRTLRRLKLFNFTAVKLTQILQTILQLLFYNLAIAYTTASQNVIIRFQNTYREVSLIPIKKIITALFQRTALFSFILLECETLRNTDKLSTVSSY